MLGAVKKMKNFSVGVDLRKWKIGRRRFSDNLPESGSVKLYFLAACFIVGTGVGAFCVRTGGSLAEMVGSSTTAMLEGRRAAGFFGVVLSALLAMLPYFAAAFFAGLFVPGPAVIPAILIFKGLGYGASAGYLYAAGGFGGMWINLLILFPGAVGGTMALLLAYREAFSFSTLLFSGTILGKENNLAANFKIYCFRFLVIFGLLLLVALLDGVASAAFLGRVSI
jgi:hypothetical protein